MMGCAPYLFFNQPQPQGQVDRALPLIVATFRGESVAIPRCDTLYGPSPSLQAHVLSAFPGLSRRSDDMTIKIKAPGMEKPVRLLVPAMWNEIWRIVTDIVVEIPPTEDEKRLEELTHAGTSNIVLETQSEKYDLKVNILLATGMDMKRLVESCTGVAVENQILLRHEYVEIQDNRTLHECGLRTTQKENTVYLKLRPKDTAPTLDVVVRSG